jgi:hypothetical protein
MAFSLFPIFLLQTEMQGETTVENRERQGIEILVGLIRLAQSLGLEGAPEETELSHVGRWPIAGR